MPSYGSAPYPLSVFNNQSINQRPAACEPVSDKELINGFQSTAKSAVSSSTSQDRVISAYLLD